MVGYTPRKDSPVTATPWKGSYSRRRTAMHMYFDDVSRHGVQPWQPPTTSTPTQQPQQWHPHQQQQQHQDDNNGDDDEQALIQRILLGYNAEQASQLPSPNSEC